MSKTSIQDPNPVPEHVLDVLSSVVVRAGHTLSWYTSKKGRIWITLKGFYPTTYSTSVEYDKDSDDIDIDHAFMVLLYRHWPKLTEQVAPLTTWDTSKAAVALSDTAEAWLTTLSSAGVPLVDIFDPDSPPTTE